MADEKQTVRRSTGKSSHGGRGKRPTKKTTQVGKMTTVSKKNTAKHGTPRGRTEKETLVEDSDLSSEGNHGAGDGGSGSEAEKEAAESPNGEIQKTTPSKKKKDGRVPTPSKKKKDGCVPTPSKKKKDVRAPTSPDASDDNLHSGDKRPWEVDGKEEGGDVGRRKNKAVDETEDTVVIEDSDGGDERGKEGADAAPCDSPKKSTKKPTRTPRKSPAKGGSERKPGPVAASGAKKSKSRLKKPEKKKTSSPGVKPGVAVMHAAVQTAVRKTKKKPIPPLESDDAEDTTDAREEDRMLKEKTDKIAKSIQASMEEDDIDFEEPARDTPPSRRSRRVHTKVAKSAEPEEVIDLDADDEDAVKVVPTTRSKRTNGQREETILASGDTTGAPASSLAGKAPRKQAPRKTTAPEVAKDEEEQEEGTEVVGDDDDDEVEEVSSDSEDGEFKDPDRLVDDPTTELPQRGDDVCHMRKCKMPERDGAKGHNCAICERSIHGMCNVRTWGVDMEDKEALRCTYCFRHFGLKGPAVGTEKDDEGEQSIPGTPEKTADIRKHVQFASDNKEDGEDEDEEEVEDSEEDLEHQDSDGDIKMVDAAHATTTKENSDGDDDAPPDNAGRSQVDSQEDEGGSEMNTAAAQNGDEPEEEDAEEAADEEEAAVEKESAVEEDAAGNRPSKEKERTLYKLKKGGMKKLEKAAAQEKVPPKNHLPKDVETKLQNLEKRVERVHDSYDNMEKSMESTEKIAQQLLIAEEEGATKDGEKEPMEVVADENGDNDDVKDDTREDANVGTKDAKPNEKKEKEPLEVPDGYEAFDPAKYEYKLPPFVQYEHHRNKGRWITVQKSHHEIGAKYWVYGLHEHGSKVCTDGTTGKVYHRLIKYLNTARVDTPKDKRNREEMAKGAFRNFLYKAGTALIYPYGKPPRDDPAATTAKEGIKRAGPKGIERARRGDHLNMDYMECKHINWDKEALSPSFTERVLGKQEDTAGSTHMRPDIVRWRRVYEKHGERYAAKQWGRFVGRGDLYAIPTNVDCDRSFATSHSAAYYLDRMTKKLEEIHAARADVDRDWANFDWKELPYFQAIDSSKAYWHQHSHMRRALLTEKIFQNCLGLFIPFDSHEAEQMTLQELEANFAATLPARIQILLKPLLSEEALPPVAYYYGVQLTLLNGLPKGSPRRVFLEECLFRELVIIRLASYLYHIQWSNRAVVQPEEVINILEESGVIGISLRLEWTPQEIITHMRKTRGRNFNPSGVTSTVRTKELYGLVDCDYHWVDACNNLGAVITQVTPNCTHRIHSKTKHIFPCFTVATENEKIEDDKKAGHAGIRSSRNAPHMKYTALYVPPGYETPHAGGSAPNPSHANTPNALVVVNDPNDPYYNDHFTTPRNNQGYTGKRDRDYSESYRGGYSTTPRYDGHYGHTGNYRDGHNHGGNYGGNYGANYGGNYGDGYHHGGYGHHAPAVDNRDFEHTRSYEDHPRKKSRTTAGGSGQENWEIERAFLDNSLKEKDGTIATLKATINSLETANSTLQSVIHQVFNQQQQTPNRQG